MTEPIHASALLARTLAAGGVEFVTAFPGSPTTTLALYLEREGAALGIEFRWAINENVALSQAFGAALGGRGAAALMKHVGVNVASDALHAMGVVHGLPAPLLLVEGADAKPGSSQSAQDNRSLYASSPQLLVLGPTLGPEPDAARGRDFAEAVRDACTISAAAGMLVVLRGDARCFSPRATGLDTDTEADPTEADAPARPAPLPAWPARGYALSTSARTYAFHLEQRREVFARLEPWLATRYRSRGLEGDARLPVALVVAAHLGADAAAELGARGLPYLRLLLEHPLPEAALRELAARCETLVVLEECTPTLEQSLAALVHRAGLPTRVIGRAALDDARPIGRVEGPQLGELLDRLGPQPTPQPAPEHAPPRRDPAALLEGLPARLERQRAAHDQAHPPSGFPDRDPRRLLFAHLRGLAEEVFIAVDPGVTGVLALAAHQSDVKMHMGGAVPIAQGWARARADSGGASGASLAVAVVGDTNLPHSEWLGILDAADHGDDLLIVIADNGHSEMTQRIVTPRPSPEQALASLAALGVDCERACASLEQRDWLATLARAAARSGPRLVWLDLPSA